MYFSDILEEEKEEARESALAEGRAEGKEEQKIESAVRLFKTSLTDEQIAEAMGLSIEEVTELRNKK